METMTVHDVVISYGIDAEEVLDEELWETRCAYVWAREEEEFFPEMDEDEESLTDIFWGESLKEIGAEEAIAAYPERAMAAIITYLKKQEVGAVEGKTPHFIVLV